MKEHPADYSKAVKGVAVLISFPSAGPVQGQFGGGVQCPVCLVFLVPDQLGNFSRFPSCCNKSSLSVCSSESEVINCVCFMHFFI